MYIINFKGLWLKYQFSSLLLFCGFLCCFVLVDDASLAA